MLDYSMHTGTMDRESVDFLNRYPMFSTEESGWINDRFYRDPFDKLYTEYLAEHGFDIRGRQVTDRDKAEDPVTRAIIAIFQPSYYKAVYGRDRAPIGEEEARAFLRWVDPYWKKWVRQRYPEKADEWIVEPPTEWYSAAELLDDDMDTL
jgi:hypothetical protein